MLFSPTPLNIDRDNVTVAGKMSRMIHTRFYIISTKPNKKKKKTTTQNAICASPCLWKLCVATLLNARYIPCSKRKRKKIPRGRYRDKEKMYTICDSHTSWNLIYMLIGRQLSRGECTQVRAPSAAVRTVNFLIFSYFTPTLFHSFSFFSFLSLFPLFCEYFFVLLCFRNKLHKKTSSKLNSHKNEVLQANTRQKRTQASKRQTFQREITPMPFCDSEVAFIHEHLFCRLISISC